MKTKTVLPPAAAYAWALVPTNPGYALKHPFLTGRADMPILLPSRRTARILCLTISEGYGIRLYRPVPVIIGEQ